MTNVRVLGLLIVGTWLLTATALAQPPTFTETYPRSAMLVPVAEMATLQDALDVHHVVRLESADYSAAPPITLRSGYQIFGLRSSLPAVTIEPGSSGIIISNARFDRGLIFPASTEVTRHNFLFEVGGDITAIGATLEENTIFGLENGTIQIDTSAGGWLRNNRFIRIRAQTLRPLLVMHGDSAHQSYGNVFLWGNQLTQPSAAVDVSGQRYVNFIGWDDEAYAATTETPIYRFADVDTLRLWTMGGASPTTTHPLFDIEATDVMLSMVRMGNSYPTPVVLRAGVERAFMHEVMQPLMDVDPSGLRVLGMMSINNNTGTPLTDHGELLLGPLSAADGEALRTLYADADVGAPWERPSFGPIADPAGPDWDSDLASQPDSTAMLQAMIDAGPVVLLEPGIYYVSSPLRIRTGTMIVGSGADVTAIVAKDPSIDIIVDGGTTPAGTVRARIQILDLTLQGGRNGVHLAGPAGEQWQYSEFLFSHVVFRDFSNAGFFIDQIFGLDNGVFDHVDFIDNGVGFKQYVDPDANPAGANSGYMDKVVFYGNRFIGNTIGAELRAQRANNLNAFINTLFQDNTERAIVAGSSNDLQAVNSDFINNGGSPSVSGVNDFISCYFRADALGVAMLGGEVHRIEGSRFERGTSSTARVFDNRDDAFFAANDAWAYFSFEYMVNSTSDDIDLGNVVFGVFLNNRFGSRPDLSVPAAQVWLSEVTTLATGAVNPRPQLLVGVDYSDMGPGEVDAGIADGGVIGPGSDGGPRSDGGGVPTDDAGCSCRVGSSAGSGPAWWLALALLAALGRRRSA